MDIIIFSGQSNMQGQTESAPLNNESIKGALEYVYLSDSLRELRHPVGELIQFEGQDLLMMSSQGFGSLVPAFCKAYVENSAREVIAVHVAKGATTIAEWQPDTLRYQLMVKKILSAKRKAQERGNVDNVYFVWLQGESDAIQGTSESDYYDRFINLKNALKKDVGVDVFGIIKVGYFASEATWYKVGDKKSRQNKDQTIMQSQERIAKENKDCIILTRLCTKISLEKEYINPFESGHYNNKAMDKIGKEAALGLIAQTR